jgi:cellulose synthase/poly-beta-1,6-N-acetylglucosamine synthase-like glycosyltransferase
MIPFVLIILLVACTVYYVLFLIQVNTGLHMLTVPIDSTRETPFVTVVLAARNEQDPIKRCVEAILAQDYPAARYEVIVVDDNSTDSTATVVESLAASRKNVRLISAGKGPSFVRGGKPASLSNGIAEAKGEIILTTDADCVVPSSWITTMVRYLQPGVAFVAGPVREAPGRSLLSKLAHLEMLGLVTTAAGLIGARRPIICNGANLGYTKSAFLSAQGYGDNQQWCDDETLMQRIHERKLGEIVFVMSEKAVVTTSTQYTFGSFWKQRLRWSAKGGHYENVRLLLIVVGLFFFFLLSLLAGLTSIFVEQLRLWFFASFISKIVIDYWTLFVGARLLRDRVTASVFVVAELLHVPYIVLTAGLGQFVSFNWKGRTLNR